MYNIIFLYIHPKDKEITPYINEIKFLVYFQIKDSINKYFKVLYK